MPRNPIVLLAALLTSTAALAADPPLHTDPAVGDCEVRFASNLTQSAFHRFAREFGSVSAFKQGAQASTLGRGKVAVGLEYMTFGVEEHAAAWNDTFVHPNATHPLGSQLTFPKLKARVGVAEDTDVGVYFAMNPQANYGWLGFDAKHVLLRQGDEMPVTLSVRGAYTKTLFVGDMDMHAVSAGASMGHTFWDRVTPYVGAGADLVIARETSPSVDLSTEVVLAPHALAGVEVTFWRLAVGLEAQLASVSSAQIQTTFVF
jgi:opacity protein-like surface antigen